MIIAIIANDRLGKKVRVLCNDKVTISDVKEIIVYKIGTKAEEIIIKRSYRICNDHLTLQDYEINYGLCLELYYR